MANASIRTVLLSLIQKRFLNTTTLSPTTTSSSSSFAVQFLINSCGLPLQSALSASRKLQLHDKNLQNPQSVLHFLKAHDFDDTHIAKLIEKQPTLLQCRVEDTLKPKFDFLISDGYVGKLLPELLLSNPKILKRALDSHIKPSLELLKSFLGSNEEIVAAVKRSSWLLSYNLKDSMQPNIDFLIKQGLNVNAVAKLILKHPRAILQKYDRMVYAVNAVKNLGLDPKALIFVDAVRIMLSMSESSWKAKIEIMKSVGWSEEEVWSAFKRYPRCMGCSEQKIRTSMDFYMNTMKLEREFIIAYPILLGFGMHKRIHPRYNVFKALESKKLIKGGVKIERLVLRSSKYFFENYVRKYMDKVPGLLEMYGGKNMKRKIHT